MSFQLDNVSFIINITKSATSVDKVSEPEVISTKATDVAETSTIKSKRFDLDSIILIMSANQPISLFKLMYHSIWDVRSSARDRPYIVRRPRALNI